VSPNGGNAVLGRCLDLQTNGALAH
jgi:hypothetical protein